MTAFVVRQFGANAIRGSYIIPTRNFCVTSPKLVDQDWRLKNGLPRNPNSYGPLTDGRDFSFVDGRPVPLGSGQVKRSLKHKAYAEKIVQFVGEMNFAVERHQRLKKEATLQKQLALDSKLKPKGYLLLKADNNKS